MNLFNRHPKRSSVRPEYAGLVLASHGNTVGQTTHGMSYSIEYNAWHTMLQRCNNPNNPGYKNYGARGISVDSRWVKFENFFADMGEKPTTKHSIDRKDNNADYCKDNCHWATRKQQNNNRRYNLVYEFNGDSKTLAEWSDEIDIPYKTMHNRIKHLGWSVERAFTQPLRKTT